MLFWKKKRKQQKPTANQKRTVVTSKPKPPPKIEKEPVKKFNPTPVSSKFKNNIPKKEPSKNVGKQDAKKEFMKVFQKLTCAYRAWDVWRDFVVMFACALSNPVDKEHFDDREKRYLKIINKYKKDEQILFPELVAYTVLALEDNQEQDFLGDIFMELKLGDGKNGQFFTPYHICELMAKCAIGDASHEIDEKGYISINDPCCGAGATLIAGVNEIKRQLERKNINYQNHVLIVAQDVDEIVALMCYIQLSLLGVAAYIKVGNTFTDPISDNDSKENYWFTPMYFSDVWSMRRLFHNMDAILNNHEEWND